MSTITNPAIEVLEEVLDRLNKRQNNVSCTLETLDDLKLGITKEDEVYLRGYLEGVEFALEVVHKIEDNCPRSIEVYGK